MIVNNSEDDICRMFNDVFNRFGDATVNLFPEDISKEQAELSAFIYDHVNNGVYKAGFASRHPPPAKGGPRVPRQTSALPR